VEDYSEKGLNPLTDKDSNKKINFNKIIDVFQFALKRNNHEYGIPIILSLLLLTIIVFLFYKKLNPNLCFIVIVLFITVCMILYFCLLLKKENQKKNSEEREKYLKEYLRDLIFERQEKENLKV
jgi:hypothetical protein